MDDNNSKKLEFKEDHLEGVLISLQTIKAMATQMASEVREHNRYFRKGDSFVFSLLQELDVDVAHAGARLDNANRIVDWISEHGSIL